jgi:hypothetical protein
MTVSCVICRKIAEAFKFFDLGPACHGCVLKATVVEASYTINGNIYSETLKKVVPPVSPIRLVQKENPPVARRVTNPLSGKKGVN